MQKCDRCQKRAGVVNEMGFERATVAPAIGKFQVVYRNGRVIEQHLCAEDVRGMRSSGLFELVPA